MRTELRDARILRFGGFELDCDAGELRKSGHALKLQPQPCRVLEVLVRHSGEVVTREELKEVVWGTETYVDFEQGVNFCIRQIRMALHDTAAEPRYLETLPKRGYRFLAEVSQAGPAVMQGKKAMWRRWPAAAVLAGVAAGAGGIWWSSRAPEAASIAVLPFSDLSPAKDHEYFAHGLAEEIFSRLTGVSGLRVVGRASAFAVGTQKSPQAIARELRVRTLLTGSVRVEGDRLRVTAQLVDAGDDRSLWSETYDRQLNAVFQIQEEIAQAIAGALKGTLPMQPVPKLATRRTANLQAYNRYLQGLYVGRKITEDSLRQAIAMQEEVIAMDPGFAPAYADLAESTHRLSIHFSAPADLVARAEKAALRALELDPRLAEAKAALGRIALSRFQWAEAERLLKDSIQLNPNYGEGHNIYGLLLSSRGRIEPSLKESRTAWELDPLSLVINRDMGLVLYWARRYEEALRQLERTNELDADFAWAYYTKAQVLLQMGRCREAIEAANRHIALAKAPSTIRTIVLAGCGMREEAAAAFEAYNKARRNRTPSAQIAIVYTALGDKERALRELEDAVAFPGAPMLGMKVNPAFDPIRNEPRFQAVLRRIGLGE